eukprot:6091881-Pleurochrysis_carterae.AAC.3
MGIGGARLLLSAQMRFTSKTHLVRTERVLVWNHVVVGNDRSPHSNTANQCCKHALDRGREVGVGGGGVPSRHQLDHGDGPRRDCHLSVRSSVFICFQSNTRFTFNRESRSILVLVVR